MPNPDFTVELVSENPDATVQVRNQANGLYGGPPPGPTKLVVQGGNQQGTVPLLEVQDTAGQPLFRIGADGWPEIRVAGVWRRVAIQ